MNPMELIVYKPEDLRPVSEMMDRLAVRERRRQWKRFVGGMVFLMLWSLFWVVVLVGWAS